MKSPRDVIIRPVVSEKSYAGLEANTYTFLVDPRANKTEIKEAIQAIWNVRVTSVNTLNRKGKVKRRGYTGASAPTRSARSSRSPPGDSIEIFESGEIAAWPFASTSRPRRAPRRERVELRRAHAEQAREVARRQGPQQGRAQRPRPDHGAAPGRRQQAPLPGDRLPAEQGRRAGQGRPHRVRPEPHGADRAAALRRRREALHPRARGRRARRPADVGARGRHPPGQRAAAAQHPGRHRGPRRSS